MFSLNCEFELNPVTSELEVSLSLNFNSSFLFCVSDLILIYSRISTIFELAF